MLFSILAQDMKYPTLESFEMESNTENDEIKKTYKFLLAQFLSDSRIQRRDQ